MADFKALLHSGVDEAVSVNQRALVEKILARYSGESTVFRELLQNADDASASTVEIHFRTTPDAGPTESPLLHPKDRLPNLKTQAVTSIMVRNDGMVFRDEDWNRLKKIAEGNPDEGKIGAFGVGWYSLFSLCEEPVVLSGSRMMQFYWKGGGDQLYVKTASDENGVKNVTKDGKPWTTILVDLREQAPMPEPTDFARFLTTCLAFTSSIRTISMHFDGHLLFRISKTLAPSRLITPHPNLASTSPLKILHLTSISEVPLQLRAEVSRWLSSYAAKPKPAVSLAAAATATSSFATKMLAAFSSKPRPTVASTPTAIFPPPSTKDPLDLLLSTLFLRTVSAELRVTPSTYFSAEMLRATKKALPKSTAYSLIWTGKDEFDASRDSGSSHAKGKGVEGDEDARKVFVGLLSDLETNGRVFIGFPTFQTTGCAASVAARFVSTVERESLDFQARHVADWNRELLWAGGILARTVYEEELANIARLFVSKGLSAEGKAKLQGRALHLMKFFTFSLSTPSPVVGSETETSFFATNRNSAITLISQLGPLPASQVRLPNPQLASFLKEIPTVPEAVSSGAPRFLAALRDRNLVRDISLEDVLADLATHALTIEEAEHCFKWWISLAANRSYDLALLSKLKEAAMISITDPDTRIHPLAGYKTFLNPKLISVDLPLPEHTLPFALTRSFAATDLNRVFQFEELSLLEWVRYLLSLPMAGAGAKADTNLLVSPHFAEKVLNTLARGWPTLSLPRHAELSTLLASHSFLPTRQGPRKPTESYFANVLLFDDLPIVTLPSGLPVKGNLEKLLTALGVRRHVELQLVFTRLLGQGDWSHVDLVKYLVSVRDTLSSSEVDRLRKTAWLPKEGGAAVVDTAAPGTVPSSRKVVRFTAAQLFEPTDPLRLLGLPVVDWSTGVHKWRTTSDEAKFLFELGLQRTPAVDQVLQIAASTDNPSRQEAALRYFLDEYSTAGFDKTYSPTKHALPFVPAVRNDKLIFAKPAEVVSNVAASLLGFAVLANRLQNDAGRLKIAQDPPPSELVVALVKAPPASVRKARDIFGYMSSQVSRLSSSDVATLRAANIIPVERAGGAIELSSPSSCFFGADTALPAGLKALFTTLPDFGPAAKPFLVAIGVKDTPSPTEITVSVVADPGRFLDLCGSADRYLAVLRMLAINYGALSSTLRSQMKTSAFFLGSMRISTSAPKKAARDDDDDDDEEAGSLIYKLARADELAVNDDPQTFRVFQSDILACPQEDSIEAFAEALGASRISQLVKEHYRSIGEPDMGSKRAAELRRAVTERTFLFLAERRQQYGKGELKHDAEWIQSHLLVSEVRSIELIRTLATAGTLKKDTQAASAFAKLDPKGDVLLFVSSDLELDYYEVAIALCRLLLSRQRPNDALLFMTILSTTLKNLKRRGFNVDRILNARQVEREIAEQRLREERLQAQLRCANALSPEKLASHEKQLGSLFPDAEPSYLRSLLQAQSGSHVENAANQLLSSNYPKRPPPPPVPMIMGEQRMPGSDSGLFGNLKRRLRPESRGASSMGDGSSQGLPTPNLAAAIPPRTGTRSSSTAAETPTSTDTIRSNVLRAIQASRPESSNSISNAVEKTQVKESESSYCDSTAAADLVFAAELGGLRFFVAREILDPPDFVRSHHAALLRFITLVVRPVGEVFGVDPRSLHIFHDLSGPLIAFNRNGSLYLNLRYYLAWHDAAVVRGELAEPLISVFHTLAHELAHNLVGPHDAEHSFYFSSLCEEKFLPMAALLARVRAAPLVEI